MRCETLYGLIFGTGVALFWTLAYVAHLAKAELLCMLFISFGGMIFFAFIDVMTDVLNRLRRNLNDEI